MKSSTDSHLKSVYEIPRLDKIDGLIRYKYILQCYKCVLNVDYFTDSDEQVHGRRPPDGVNEAGKSIFLYFCN